MVIPFRKGQIIVFIVEVIDFESAGEEVFAFADLFFDDQVPGVTPVDEYLCIEGSGTSVASTGSAANDGTLTAVTWEANNVPSKERSSITQDRTPIS